MSTAASDVTKKNQTDPIIEHLKSSWEHIHGDLTKFLSDPESDECIVFERILPTDPAATKTAVASAAATTVTAASTAASASVDKKNIQELAPSRAVTIIIHRVQSTIVDFAPTRTDKIIPNPAGGKPYALFIGLGAGIRQIVDDPYFPTAATKLRLTDEQTKLFENPIQEYAFKYFSESLMLQYEDERFRPVAKKLGKAGRIQFSEYINLVTGNMRSTWVQLALEGLQKLNILSREDITFLMSFVKTRQPSAEELKAETELQNMLAKSDFEGAVLAATTLHTISRKEALKRGSGQTCTMNFDGVRKLMLLDDCDAAFKLGEHLESISPQDAANALEIITPYQFDSSGPVKYESPYLRRVIDKASDIQVNLIGLQKNEAQARVTRKEAMKAVFAKFGSGDMESTNSDFKKLIKLLETQAGFENYGAEDRLFDNLTVNIQSPLDAIDTLQNIIFTMADKLYDNRKVKYAAAALPSSVDVKSQKETAAQKADTAASAVAQPLRFTQQTAEKSKGGANKTPSTATIATTATTATTAAAATAATSSKVTSASSTK